MSDENSKFIIVKRRSEKGDDKSAANQCLQKLKNIKNFAPLSSNVKDILHRASISPILMKQQSRLPLLKSYDQYHQRSQSLSIPKNVANMNTSQPNILPGIDDISDSLQAYFQAAKIHIRLQQTTIFRQSKEVNEEIIVLDHKSRKLNNQMQQLSGELNNHLGPIHEKLTSVSVNIQRCIIALKALRNMLPEEHQQSLPSFMDDRKSDDT